MAGRGDGKIFRPSPNPAVQIGLTVTTSPINLPISPTTPTTSDPFHIVITACVLSTPHPSLPITLCAHRNLFDGFSFSPTFRNIYRAYPPPIDPTAPMYQRKHINLFLGWPNYRTPMSDNLADFMDFITIPSLDSGETVSVKVSPYSKNFDCVNQHEVWKSNIEKAALCVGEVYEVSMTDRCMGTTWWQYGALEEGIRIGYHEGDINREGWARNEAEERLCREARERRERGERVARGEEPEALKLVDETGPVRFEVVAMDVSGIPDIGGLDLGS